MLVSKTKHKGVSKKIKVVEQDYIDLIVNWDKQFDQNHIVKNYSIEKRLEIFEELMKKTSSATKLESEDEVDEQESGKKKKKKSKKKKKKNGNKSVVSAHKELFDELESKLFTSRSFYTTAVGVFKTLVQKRLGVSPSDKVLFPRSTYGSFSVGSRFANAVKHFNKNKTYDELFSDEHLSKLFAFENHFLENMPRHYMNGVCSKHIIKLEEEIDYKVSTMHLVKQMSANEEQRAPLKSVIQPDRLVDGETDDEIEE